MHKKILILIGLVVLLVVAIFVFGKKTDLLTSRCGPQPRPASPEILQDMDNWNVTDEGGYGYKFKTPKFWSLNHIENGQKNTHLVRTGSSITITEITTNSDKNDCGSTITVGEKQYNVKYTFDKDHTPSESLLKTMDGIVSTIEYSATESKELDLNTIYKISGYYTTYNKQILLYDDPNRDAYPATTTCSAFVVLNGDPKFITYFKDQISSGNTINRLDVTGNLMINLKPEEFQASQKNLILKSNKQNLISLEVKPKPPLEIDGPACYSKITVISAQ